mmetsp:Transcript_512/g.1481  ORF Transcript_512/g.1481 Transcript_512/m.1481 type:complete len:207 (+) Transcript_512:32-652(+)
MPSSTRFAFSYVFEHSVAANSFKQGRCQERSPYMQESSTTESTTLGNCPPQMMHNTTSETSQASLQAGVLSSTAVGLGSSRPRLWAVHAALMRPPARGAREDKWLPGSGRIPAERRRVAAMYQACLPHRKPRYKREMSSLQSSIFFCVHDDRTHFAMRVACSISSLYSQPGASFVAVPEHWVHLLFSRCVQVKYATLGKRSMFMLL